MRRYGKLSSWIRPTKVGIAKTPKANGEKLDKLTFAVISCSNYPTGYFHAYDIGSTITILTFGFMQETTFTNMLMEIVQEIDPGNHWQKSLSWMIIVSAMPLIIWMKVCKSSGDQLR